MIEITVKSAAKAEQDAVTAIVVAAFVTDPIARWLWPEPHQYFAAGASFTRAFAGNAFASGSAYYVDGYGGAALWLPPGIHTNEDVLMAALKSSIADERQENAFALFEQMGNCHPEEPHWYLPVTGVDPIHQGHGYGSALLKHALLPCDRDKKLAYLESTNPRNLSLYIRHGFEIITTIQVADSPPIFPMLRKPRT